MSPIILARKRKVALRNLKAVALEVGEWVVDFFVLAFCFSVIILMAHLWINVMWEAGKL